MMEDKVYCPPLATNKEMLVLTEDTGSVGEREVEETHDSSKSLRKRSWMEGQMPEGH